MSIQTVQAATPDPAIADLKQELSTLTAAVQALTTNRHDDRGRAQDRGRSGRRGRSKSRGRRDRSSSPPHSGVCFYHHRFGEKARNCEKPCSFKSEKFPSRAVNATTLSGSTTLGRLLHVRDRLHNVKFLVDTGAAVSVLPPSYCPLSSVSRSSSFRSPKLQAANSSPIATHGQQLLEIDLGLRRPFRWVFIIADVRQPILGANFIGHFNLSVDIAGHAAP